MVIQPYDEGMADEWDDFVQRSAIGNMLHTRRFLSYHGNRFDDRSLLLRDDHGKLIALFPAALAPSDKTTVVSHPGSSYGGIIGGDQCRGDMMLQVMRSICAHYKNHGVLTLQYKAVPFIYHKMPVQDDLYALFRLNADRYRCDLSATIDLNHRGRIGSRRKRAYKKAVKSGVKMVSGLQYASGLWGVLQENLKDKHGAKPVHALDEIELLYERFPEQIQFVVAVCDHKVEAGVVLFKTDLVAHSQYIASSATGYAVNALDMVFEHCIAEAKDQGKRYFDFGISNEDAGRVLNAGLYGFKSEFGAGSAVHEFYAVDLEQVNVS